MKHQLGVLRAWAAFGISTRAWKRFFSALNALVIYSVKLTKTKASILLRFKSVNASLQSWDLNLQRLLINKNKLTC